MRPLILFVCPHGAAKSVIAAAYFRRLAGRRGLRLDAAAAGTEPDETIPAAVVDGLLADGLDLRGQRPRRVTAAELASAARVVSFGCELPGAASPVERWDDVPAVSADFAAARAAILARVERLVDECARTSRPGG